MIFDQALLTDARERSPTEGKFYSSSALTFTAVHFLPCALSAAGQFHRGQ